MNREFRNEIDVNKRGERYHFSFFQIIIILWLMNLDRNRRSGRWKYSSIVMEFRWNAFLIPNLLLLIFKRIFLEVFRNNKNVLRTTIILYLMWFWFAFVCFCMKVKIKFSDKVCCSWDATIRMNLLTTTHNPQFLTNTNM